MTTRSERDQHYHDKGEQDASKGSYNTPYPVGMVNNEPGTRADNDAYQKGHTNTTNQKKG